MSKILILAQSGFGKSTSIGKIPELNIEGLNPEETFIISVTSKPLPFPKSGQMYKICDPNKPPTKENGNRFITNNGTTVANVIDFVNNSRPDITTLILDDANYVMQDYYMENAHKKGYEVFKEIGYFMNKIFNALENAKRLTCFVLAHYEDFRDSTNDTISYRFKTVGKMVQDYITPEGKFDIVLYGKQTMENKKVKKIYVTNFDGQFPAKSSYGIFDEIEIPNDLGFIKKKIEEYYV